MNDDELRRLLQTSLQGRRTPTEARERVLQNLRPRTKLRIAAAAAAALLLVAGIGLAAGWARAPRTNPTIRRAIEQHMLSQVFGHAAVTSTPREIAQTVSEVSGRDIHMPGMRDGGFTQMEAHCCEATGWAHVIYANSWLKLSCFVLDPAELDLSGGTRLAVPGLEAWSFVRGAFSVVALRESGLAKIWVGDLSPEHLASIAVDAEQKRHQMQTSVLSVADKGSARQLGAMLQSTPGVEDFQMEPSKQEAVVRYDRRRVTLEELVVMLETNGFAARPRDWEVR
ncbi:MAG TPA: hypothetical protein VE981_21015 [Planctomycetota bacterium]|nr:hypothetical protein [Planctomycetota bacterium]